MTTLYDRIGGRVGLEKLLHQFYSDVRQHKIIGPIFNEKIHDWPKHLAIITEFWARQTGGPSAYSGGMAAKHFSLGLQPEHFVHWLALWDFNCRRHLPETESGELTTLAHHLANHLQKIVAGGSGLSID